MTFSIIYFILSFIITENLQPIYSLPAIQTIENSEEIPLGLDVKSSITISDFKTLLNGVLKSSKNRPLFRKGDFLVWHRGTDTKLMSATGNKIRFQSDFYIRHKKVFSVTTQKTAVINVTAKYNNKTNKIDLSFTIENIKNFPGAFENWFKTNKTKYSKVSLPAYVKKIKAGNLSVGFKKPSGNKLQINLITPLNPSALSSL